MELVKQQKGGSCEHNITLNNDVCCFTGKYIIECVRENWETGTSGKNMASYMQ